MFIIDFVHLGVFCVLKTVVSYIYILNTLTQK